jgi:hypothetical protein
MQKEDFEYFENISNVKLVLKNEFTLYGTILRVSDDCIVFKTSQKTSILPMSDILKVLEW